MKLLFCRSCVDVVKLQYHWRRCDCGQSGGRYLSDGAHAEIAGEHAECLGIDNWDVRRIAYGIAERAEWWIMHPGEEGVRVQRVDEPPA